MSPTRLLPALLLCAAPATAAPGYPIDPVSLLGLYEQASTIVVAKVEDCTVHTEPGSLNGWCARLQVREVLAGEPTRDPLHVRYSRGMVCPAPPSYREGERVLAFLAWNADWQVHSTCSLSYGTKYPDDEGLAVYRERIEELGRLQKVLTKDRRFRQAVEWLVKCAEHPATFDEARIELTRRPTRGSRGPDYGGAMTPSQCGRLANVLAAVEHDGKAFPTWVPGLMAAIARALDDEVLDELVSDFRRPSRLGGDRLESRQHLLDAFVRGVDQRTR